MTESSLYTVLTPEERIIVVWAEHHEIKDGNLIFHQTSAGMLTDTFPAGTWERWAINGVEQETP